jgi:hypothetical protein
MKSAKFGMSAVQELTESFANLIVAEQATNRSEHEASRTALQTLTNQHAASLKRIDELQTLLLKATSNAVPGATAPKTKVPKVRAPKTDQGSYCWSHGYLCHKDHTSMNCMFPKAGHCKEATRGNNMGGNQEGKPVV